MADFVTLSCPSCGGKLQITNDIERFACGYCGKEHIVKRGGGIVTLSPVIDGLKRIQEGTDRTASELAILRLGNEITEIERGINEIQVQLMSQYGESLHDYFAKYTSLWDKTWHPRNVNLQKELRDLTTKDTEAMLKYFQGCPDGERPAGLVFSVDKLSFLQKGLCEKQSELAKHKNIVAT